MRNNIGWFGSLVLFCLSSGGCLSPHPTCLFFVGSNSDKAGLRVLDLDAHTGTIRQVSQVDEAINPLYLVASSDGKYLYAAQRVSPDTRGYVGGVAVYACQNHKLRKLAEYACTPSIPCHLSLSPDGHKLAFAEYEQSRVGFFTVRPDGLLDGPVAQIQQKGQGPNPRRQEAAHAHCAVFTPDATRLCVCDLGLDHVFVYDAASQNETLHEVKNASFQSAPGAGPRHLIFHPTAKLAFLINELDSTVVSLRLDDQGALTPIETYSLLPDHYSGQTTAAAIKISPDGHWLLASNRGFDSLVSFAINQTNGRLSNRTINKLNGPHPRDFAFSPEGRFIAVGHMLADEVAVYRFDNHTGRIDQTANTLPLPKPLCLVFAKPSGDLNP